MSRSLPTLLVRSWHRITFRWRRAHFYRDLAEELETHALLKQNAICQSGLGPQAAVYRARCEMGNITLAKEECRDMWTFIGIERFLQDFLHGLRLFGKTPLFTAVAVLSLTLGIGGNAAIFSLVNALLIRPLPYSQPENLVRITGIYPRAALPFFHLQTRAMDVAAASAGSEFNLTGQGPAVRLTGSTVSSNFFSVLGASPAQGAAFQSGDELPGRDGQVMISTRVWKERFNGDAAVLGRVVTLNGVHRQITGIMPPGFSYPSANIDLWIPMRLDPSNFLEYWAGEYVPLLARLRPGSNLHQAQSEIEGIVPQFRKTFPFPMARDWNADAGAIPLQQDIVGDVRGRLIILLASVAAVLLIACANVASLLLSRATTRRKEIALRAALGAGRLRIVRQLLTESLALALVSAAFGIAFGIAMLSLFKSLLPAATPGLAQAAIDWRVILAVTALALITGLAFGLAPAFSASQVDLTDAIKTGSQRSTAGFWTRLRSILIASEVALTVILVVSAGLLLRTLYKLSGANPGFNPSHILALRVSPNQLSCSQRPSCIAFYDRLIAQTRGISNITTAAAANSVPLDGQVPAIPVDVQDHPITVDHPAPMLWLGAVTTGYFGLLDIPLLAGRAFAASDSLQSPSVAIISAATAKHFWPNESAIGKHIKPAGSKQWRTVVGVVADVRQYSLAKVFPAWIAGAVYMPYSQSEREDGQIPAAMTLLVKSSNATNSALATELQQLAESQNPDVPVGAPQHLQDIVTGSISTFRATMRVFLCFALTALLLAAVGIYGLMSYWVSQRTYEIGLRVAVGASRRGVVAMILAQGLRVSSFGALIGLFTAFLVTRFLASLLYGVAATDLITFAAVTALILLVAALATAVPAWRAARIDPVTSLRAD